MSSSLTSRLGLVKPDPGTGELVNVATQINATYDKIDAAIGATPVTSATRPASPYHGQFIRETDTRRLYVRNATDGAWDQVVLGGPSRMRSPIDIERDTAGSSTYNGYVAGESNSRFSIQADGKINWGSGSASTDTNLYRSAAGVLATDSAVTVAGDYIAGSNNGVNAPAVSTGSNTLASTTYVDMTGTGSQTSFSVTKRHAAAKTRLKVYMSANHWISGGGTPYPVGVQYGVRINGVDVDMFTLYIEAVAGNNRYGNAFAYVTGLAAGTYTVQGRWRKIVGPVGTGTPVRDTGDWLTIMAEEVSV